MYVTYRNSLRTRPRSYQAYLLGSLGFGVLTLVAVGGLGAADEHHPYLLTLAMFVATAWCFVYALALFARGAFRGGLRRAFSTYAVRTPPSMLPAMRCASTSSCCRTADARWYQDQEDA
jgi:hypothetical protein